MSTNSNAHKPRISQLNDLDKAIKHGAGSDEQAIRNLWERGKLRTGMRFSQEAIKDLKHALARKEALEQRSPKAQGAAETPIRASVPKYSVLAHLAEAIRVDARDRITSMPAKSSELSASIRESIDAFTAAIQSFEFEKGPKDHLSWMHAHRGACHTMRLFVGVTSNASHDVEADFAAAATDFRRAEEVFGKRYVWARRFHAFALALRGRVNDFGDARKILESLQDVSPELDAPLNDSYAQLCSYAAFKDPEAAMAGIEAALRAEDADPEAFRACHSRAICHAALVERDPQDQELRANLASAIQTANTQVADAMAQALVIMANLAILEGLFGGLDARAAAERANRIFATFESIGIRPSIEAMAMLLRSPAYRAVQSQLDSASESERKTEYYARCASLAEGLNPNLDDLRASLAATL